jgi:hypothetical protein
MSVKMRTTTLFGAAVAIGIVGGVGTGYAIQATRPATPLPPLAQTQPRYAPVAVYQGIAPAMLPGSQDDATLTDGDLTKLLLPTPAGATTYPDLWDHQLINVEQDSDLCDNAVTCFSDDYNEGVVAIADTNWLQNGYHYEIRIFRFAPGKSTQALQWSNDDAAQSNLLSLPAGVSGSGYEYADKYGSNDDTASAVHGDLVVKFWVSSTSVVPNPSLIDGLISQQMERL